MIAKNSEHRLQLMHECLQQLTPTLVEIVDQSAHHAGHAGAQSGGGHYALTIASPQFTGKTTLMCHRLIYSALGDLMKHDVHALTIRIVA